VDIARAGYIGISVDGPHGGLRNVSKGDEQFLMFNIFNGGALRDNVRQSALELVVQRRALDSLEIDTSDCAGAPARAKIDAGHVALLGHSMGATIAPLVLAAEPRYGAAILSGAGASWVENVMHKKKPLEVRPALELLIGYARERKLLTAHDPMVTMLQWAAEPADPQVYAHLVAPRHVLMFQGIVDRYILPRIANALALPLGLDLAGPVLDKGHPELAEQTSIEAVLPLVGRKVIPLPAQGNQAGATAVVVQHPEDGIDDGHEVMYQLAAPKEQYRCFLATFARGTPLVTQPGVTCD
jgi:pimeloyl-ACP methyl ester carboxylesterase